LYWFAAHPVGKQNAFASSNDEVTNNRIVMSISSTTNNKKANAITATTSANAFTEDTCRRQNRQKGTAQDVRCWSEENRSRTEHTLGKDAGSKEMKLPLLGEVIESPPHRHSFCCAEKSDRFSGPMLDHRVSAN
jgi:hypothetical protein